MLVKRNKMLPAFPRFFDDFFNLELSDWWNTNLSPMDTSLPAVNIKDEKNTFIIEVAAPGTKKENFQIHLKDNLLTISSEKKEEDEVIKDNYTRKEYSYHSFKRTFPLPENIVDSDKISAKYENGELLITIPKKEEVNLIGSRQIKVK